MSTQSETGKPNYPPPPPNREKTSDAAKAALCGLIPGVGAVYNQDYMKAVVHLAAFSSLCIFTEANGIFGLLAFVFYVFTIFDAYRSALDPQKKREFSSDQINMPLWGVVLIILGVVFLLDSLDAISIRAITKFWPLGLVFLGCYMVFQYFISGKNKKAAPGKAAPMPGVWEPESPANEGCPSTESPAAEAPSTEGNDPVDQQDKEV
ncbi:MAG: DUF5668 domain-containing protein [Acidobacteriota bacterium]